MANSRVLVEKFANGLSMLVVPIVSKMARLFVGDHGGVLYHYISSTEFVKSQLGKKSH